MEPHQERGADRPMNVGRTQRSGVDHTARLTSGVVFPFLELALCFTKPVKSAASKAPKARQKVARGERSEPLEQDQERRSPGRGVSIVCSKQELFRSAEGAAVNRSSGKCADGHPLPVSIPSRKAVSCKPSIRFRLHPKKEISAIESSGSAASIPGRC